MDYRWYYIIDQNKDIIYSNHSYITYTCICMYVYKIVITFKYRIIMHYWFVPEVKLFGRFVHEIELVRSAGGSCKCK